MTRHGDREAALLRDSERTKLVFDAARIGSWALDRASGVIEWDAAMEALCGLEPGTFAGTLEAVAALVHPDDRESLTLVFPEEHDWSAEIAAEHRVVWPDGSVHWLEQRGRGVVDATGTPIGIVGVGINIDDRKRIESVELEAISLRASAALADRLQDAERIAKLGSWYWNANENTVTLSREMAVLLKTGERLTGQEFRAALERVAHPDDTAILYDAPLRAIGTHQPFALEQRLVVNDEERLVLHRGEVDLNDDGTVAGLRGTSQDVTDERRAEQVLVARSERLVQERRAVVVLRETLIRPDFPALPGYQIAAEYRAAEHHSEIGGDWYDAFLVPDGRLMLTIGDLSGHGIVAARFMAKLRHAARGYAILDPDPAVVLTRLNHFMHHFAPEHFATAQVALLTPATGQGSLASAGHPPALHLHANTATLIDTPTSLPLGVLAPDTSPTPTDLTVHHGDALLLYTDGLIERRTESLDDGLRRLAQIANTTQRAAAANLIAATVHGCLLNTEQADDACILALVRNYPSYTKP